jgi:hypothetical protein
LINKDGAKYVGGFKNGKMHGKASYKHPAVEYEGEYEDDEFHGHVFIKFIDEKSIETFEGQYTNGKKNGFGIQRY